MIPEKMIEVLKHEGVVSIVTEGKNGSHVANTWNSYLKVAGDNKIIYPAGGMNTTEANIKENNKVLMTLGSREVMGFHAPGTGFLLTGTACFIKGGEQYDEVKERFPWARAAVEITLDSVTQTL